MRVRFNQSLVNYLNSSKYLYLDFPCDLNNCIVELGMGKGEMITSIASHNPTKEYIGVEKNATIAAKAAKRAIEAKINNFRILLINIEEITEKCKGKASKIFLTFPDPWPKKAHEKRRLTSERFLEIFKTILDKDGLLIFKTDNLKLFEYSMNSFQQNGWKIINFSFDLHNSIFANQNVFTGYEQKFYSKSQKINYLEAKFT